MQVSENPRKLNVRVATRDLKFSRILGSSSELLVAAPKACTRKNTTGKQKGIFFSQHLRR